ncbi:MAG: virulence-associated E family protein [Allisonella histaminiformans]|uniref:virulence-associated E family protein n=1 Tax=Allisonella histaminiformans TaxID=209880 RepID=UPI0023545A85|nr:virulence-associated E family protein [Allisonella histaminiformans]MCI6003829.1 virulence-associated E family protein [Allisonella histaminiformans]
MQNNRMLQISTGGSRKATHWPKSSILWSEFAEKLKVPVRGTETLEQYLSFPKARQDELKDVGGFVGGTFVSDRRKASLVEGRDLVTLDMDNIPAGQTDDLLRRVGGLGCAALVYSTRKHADYAPRIRVVIPLDHTCTADEYEPAARKLASLIGIEFCDPTTFEASRLMYWASCCSDSRYVYEVYDNPFCSLEGILGMYGDWTDISQWPQVPGAEAIERRRVAKQEDPTTKRGVIGAFCRTYSITQAMDRFIPGMYEETAMPGRYTYTGGSTVGGAIVYDGDMFLYSHHATDPCSGQLVNAFDLVRLHMFGDRDNEAKEGTPVNKLPSFVAMSRLALDDKSVSDLLAKERFEQAQQAFQAPGSPTEDKYDLSWIGLLTKDASGRFEKTINNMVLVLENDPLLKGRIVTDEFASCGMVLGKMPWNQADEKRRWKDADDAGYYRYMEMFYGLTGREKLDNALLIVSSQNRINDVKEYLKSLKWDGQKRVDTLLSVYLGADDNAYTREVMRKSLCAAVARGIIGGVKYDYMPIFTGPQGIGKSTFLSILGKGWFSDSLTTFEGKEAAELIQGTWINEVGELTAMTKQETSAVKQFLSKTEDIYRAAYGRRTEKYPRRCVFFGTSNDGEFLKDATGNRRFWPVDVGVHPAKKSVWKDLPEEVDQVWAEAYAYWTLGEPLYLSGEAAELAVEQQNAHRESSGKEGLIIEFLEKKIPQNWDKMSLQDRRMFWNGNLKNDEALVPREKVCAMEIWTECLHGEAKYFKKTDSVEINNILSGLEGWKRNKSKRRFGPYGILSGFERCCHCNGNK